MLYSQIIKANHMGGLHSEGKLIYLVVEPTHLNKYAQVKLDHFPRVRGETNIFLKAPKGFLEGSKILQSSA